MATANSLMTAEEYMALRDSFDGPTELVKGELVTMPPGRPRHGEICLRIAYWEGTWTIIPLAASSPMMPA
jgi:hypothetical protein